MSHPSRHPDDRRREARTAPAGDIRVRRTLPVMPLSDAEVLNTSAHGVALRTRVPTRPGDRLSFSPDPSRPPILAEVLAAESIGDGFFRVRCRCLLGGFEAA